MPEKALFYKGAKFLSKSTQNEFINLVSELNKKYNTDFKIELNNTEIQEAVKVLKKIIYSNEYVEFNEINNLEYLIGLYLTEKISHNDFLKHLVDFKTDKDDKKYVIFLYSNYEFNDMALSILKEICHDNKDINIIKVDNKKLLILLSPYKNEYSEKNIYDRTASIVYTINSEALFFAKSIYSPCLSNLSDIKQIYNDMLNELKIMETFRSGNLISKLGDNSLEALIYNNDIEICKKLLHNIYECEYDIIFTDETIHTLNTYLESNMNIASAAKKLHMHRNTLIYRLEQFYQKTNIDVRTFDGAQKFIIAIKLNAYINHMENRNE